VTGDMDLLSLGAHQRVQIVRPTDFLKILRGAQ
jgi:predicted nucleic acid-binding protein